MNMCTLTTSRTLFNFKVIVAGQGHVGFFMSAGYPRAVLSLERGFHLFLLQFAYVSIVCVEGQ